MSNMLSGLREERRGGYYAWVVLGLFWIIYFLNHADRQILFAVFPLLEKELGLTNVQLGLLGSSFQWVYAMLVPAAGLLGDAVNRKTVICSALFLWSATTAFSGMVTGFAAFLILRAATGCGEALYYPAATSIISDYHGEKTRAMAMSIHQTSLYFGVVMSGTIAGYVGQHYGWRAAFLGFGVVGVGVALLAYCVLREPRRGGGDGQLAAPETMGLTARVAEVFRSPASAMLMVCFCGMSFSSVAIVTWMPTLLYRSFHYSLAEAGFHATFYHQLGAFVGVLAGGHISDRGASRSVLSRPTVQAVGLLGAAPFVWWLGHTDSRTAMFTALGLFGVFRGLYDSNLFASLYEVIRPQARATATGLMLSAGFLVGGSSPVVVGRLSQSAGLGPALGWTALGYAAAGLLMTATTLFWFGDCARRIAKQDL